jgi:hypothetical protein
MGQFCPVCLLSPYYLCISINEWGLHRMAEEYGLIVEYKEEFHQVFDEYREHPEFRPLMLRMKVVDSNGESAMDEDQWEAASANELPSYVPMTH